MCEVRLSQMNCMLKCFGYPLKPPEKSAHKIKIFKFGVCRQEKTGRPRDAKAIEYLLLIAKHISLADENEKLTSIVISKFLPVEKTTVYAVLYQMVQLGWLRRRKIVQNKCFKYSITKKGIDAIDEKFGNENNPL